MLLPSLFLKVARNTHTHSEDSGHSSSSQDDHEFCPFSCCGLVALAPCRPYSQVKHPGLSSSIAAQTIGPSPCLLSMYSCDRSLGSSLLETRQEVRDQAHYILMWVFHTSVLLAQYHFSRLLFCCLGVLVWSVESLLLVVLIVCVYVCFVCCVFVVH